MHNQFISGNPFINTTYQLLGKIIPNPARAEFVNSTQEKKGVHPPPVLKSQRLEEEIPTSMDYRLVSSTSS